MKSTLAITLIQTDTVWENRDANYAKVKSMTAGIAPGGLIVLPEMFATGFTMDSARFAEDREGPTESFLQELAKEKDCYAAGGWIEKNPGGLPFNTFSAASPDGKIIARYRKLHPFSFAGEDKYYSSGEGTVRFQIEGFVITPFICYDLRFPEVFREMVPETSLFLVIGNWPASRINHWIALLRARAIENQAYVAGVNRVGLDTVNGIEYNGFSSVFDPMGEGKMNGSGQEDIHTVEISLEKVRETREKFPFLKDRRG